MSAGHTWTSKALQQASLTVSNVRGKPSRDALLHQKCDDDDADHDPDHDDDAW